MGTETEGGKMIEYEWPRAVYIKQLTEPDLRRLHDREIENGRPHTCLEMREYMFYGKINKVGKLSADELEQVEREIDRHRPPYKDSNTNDYYTEMEYRHVMDFNIFFHSHKEEFTVGKLGNKKSTMAYLNE